MGTDREDKAEAVGEALVGALFAGSAALVAGGSAVAGAGLSLAPKAIGQLVKQAVKAKQREWSKKARAWFTEVGILMELGSVEAAHREVLNHIDEKWAYDSVVQGARAIVDDINDACLPHLARLTAHSFATRTPPNERTRRAMNLLVDLGPEELEQLKHLVSVGINAVPTDVLGLSLVLSKKSASSATFVATLERAAVVEGYKVDLQVNRQGEAVRVVAQVDTSTVMFDVFRLMKKHGFASDTPSGFWGVQSGPHVASVLRFDIEYLDRVLGARPSTASNSAS